MTNYTFQSLFDFTRTTSGTFVGSNGLIQTTPASVNLLTYTQDWTNVVWLNSNITVSANSTTSPDGTNTADTFTPTTSDSSIRQQATPAGVSPHTFSVWLRSATGSDISTTLQAWRVAPFAVVTSTTITVTNVWQRFTLTFTPLDATAHAVVIGGASTLSTGENLFAWGAQLQTGSTATDYTRNNGGVYPARFDYDPATLQPKGILIEEQRVNVVLTSAFQTLAGSAGSQYPSGTGWSNFGATGGTRTYVASSVFTGAQAMDIVGVSAARNFIGFSFAAASSTTYTVSFYVESVSGVTGTVAYTTGTLGTGGTTNFVVAPTTTGRYSYTFTTGTSAGTVDLRLGIGASTNESGSIRISNVQCEAGAFATSYIPTVASQVTRAADQCSIVAPLFAPWYNQSEGTLVAEGTIFGLNVTAASGIAALSNGTSAENTAMFRSGGANNLTGEMRDGSVTQATFTTPLGSQPFKVALAYATNNTNLAQNGTVQTTDTVCTTPTVDRLVIGAVYSAGDFPTNGHIRSIKFYPFRASNNQLQALTT